MVSAVLVVTVVVVLTGPGAGRLAELRSGAQGLGLWFPVVFFLAYRNTVEIDPDEVDQDGAEDGGETGRIPGTPDGAVPDGQDSPVSAGGTAPTRPVRALSRWPIDGTYWSPTGPHHGERRRSEHSHGSTRIRGDEQGR